MTDLMAEWRAVVEACEICQARPAFDVWSRYPIVPHVRVCSTHFPIGRQLVVGQGGVPLMVTIPLPAPPPPPWDGKTPDQAYHHGYDRGYAQGLEAGFARSRPSGQGGW